MLATRCATMLVLLGVLLYECVEWASPAICLIDLLLFCVDIYFCLVLLAYYFNKGSISVSTATFF